MPQQLFIPPIGAIITLAEDWTFRLFFEHRNATLLQAYCPTEPEPKRDKETDYSYKYRKKNHGSHVQDFEGSNLVEYERALSDDELQDAYRTYHATSSRDKPFIRATIPAGSQLVVDRVYIRKGVEAFNSITFRTTKIGPDKKFHSKRFWAKLQDVNKIVCDIVG